VVGIHYTYVTDGRLAVAKPHSTYHRAVATAISVLSSTKQFFLFYIDNFIHES